MDGSSFVDLNFIHFMIAKVSSFSGLSLLMSVLGFLGGVFRRP